MGGGAREGERGGDGVGVEGAERGADRGGGKRGGEDDRLEQEGVWWGLWEQAEVRWGMGCESSIVDEFPRKLFVVGWDGPAPLLRSDFLRLLP
jgi:hypothetical protein